MKFVKLFFAAAVGVALASCGDGIHPTGPDESKQLSVKTSESTAGASVTTDKTDYSPGETVTITGTGWMPGETVALLLEEDADIHPPVSWTVQADQDGNFTDTSFSPESHDVGVTLTLTATGQTSGSSATAVFTDGRFIDSATLNGVSAVTVAPSASIAAVVNGHTTCTGPSLGCAVSGGSTTSDTDDWKSTQVEVTGPTPGGTSTTSCFAGPGVTAATAAASHSFSLTAPSAVGTYDVKFKMYRDLLCAGAAASGQESLNGGIIVEAPSNTAPVLGAIGDKSVVEGNELTFTASATDDGLPAPPALTYSLANPASGTFPTGATIGATSGVFSWTPSEAQGPATYRVKVVVSDGALSDEEEIEIGVTEGNAAPVLTAIGNKNVDELVLLSFTAGATDSDLPANTLTFSLGTPACVNPAIGAAITSGGAFTWTPTEAQGPGTFCARIQVSDGSLTDFEDIQITVAEVNVAPVLTSIGPKSVDEEALLSFSAAATDDDLPANTLTFSLGTPACVNPATGAAITSGGAFTWTPTEAQGPGTFCARIQVFDGTASDFEDIVITVAEVNVAPVLTVPASFSTQWGVAISGVQASATDADAPANTLTFSLVSPPAGMTIDGTTGVISWTPTSAQVGSNVITVKVTDDGVSSLDDDDPTFTITVGARPTKLTYTGNFAGQYSDKDWLKATLTDDGDGVLNGTAISSKMVRFVFGGSNVGPDATDASGVAEILYQILKPDGNYTVTANFNGDAAYAGSSDTDNTFDVDPEDATVSPDAGNLNAFQVSAPGGNASFTLKFDVREDTDPAPEPAPNDGAMAGAIDNAGLTLTLVAVANGGSVSATCSPSVVGTGYAAIKTFTCPFASVAVGAYEVAAVIANGGSPAGTYYRGGYDDAITIYDPSLGFVTGGGKFILDGDRVSFGLVFNFIGKGKTTPRGNLVVVRHHADGSSCRTKSNAIDAPAIVGNTATFSGKANYGCVDALGVALPGGAGNLTLTGYVEDNGEPGSSASLTPDKFWVRVMGELLMPTPGASNAKLLTGGNIQVPQPQGKK